MRIFKNTEYLIKTLFAISLICISQSANANAGIPMLAIAWPILWSVFIPVVLIEWLVLKRYLSTISSKNLLYVTFLSNLFSTLVGIPLAWLIMFVFEAAVLFSLDKLLPLSLIENYPKLKIFLDFFLFIVTSAWTMPPNDNVVGLFWFLPITLTILLIPFFFISYWLEAKVTLRLLKGKIDFPEKIKLSVWTANVCSYLFIFLLILILSISLTLIKNPREEWIDWIYHAIDLFNRFLSQH